MKSTFIAWTRYDRHSDLLSQRLGASMHHISCGQHGKVLQAPARYVVQAYKTWQVLCDERPDVIFIQNPPLPSVVVSFLYAKRFRARYVIDSHTAAFLSPKWRWSLGLHRMLSRGAITTLVTNRHLENVVRGWGCPAFVLAFTPGEYPAGEAYPFAHSFNAAVVSTGAEDEPIDIALQAALSVPDIGFYVTGDSKRIAPQLLAERPANVHLTGYLPYERYVGILRGADVVIDLTKRDHTLLLGAYEAVSIGTPLIVSDWPVLRDYFSKGTVHVANTVEGLLNGIGRARREHATLQREILELREQLELEWTIRFAELQRLLANGKDNEG